MKLVTTLIAGALAIAAPATADEVWSTDIGDVIYERDLETGAAVLSYPLGETAGRGLGYIDGLAGQYTGRGSYSGVWIEPSTDDNQLCAYAIANPETGAPEYNWGRLEMIFVDPDFPGAWVIQRGACFETPNEYLVGKPMVAAPTE